MKRKLIIAMMVTVAMAASVFTGCGSTAEEASYSTSVTAGQAAAEAGKMAGAAKMGIGEALADTKKMDTIAEDIPGAAKAVGLEEKPAAEEKGADTKTAEKEAADTKAGTKADTEAAEAASQPTAPQESQGEAGGYAQFIGAHAVAGDTPARTADSQQAAGTKPGAVAGTQQEAPTHQHVWKEHKATKREWVPDTVEVDDYLTQTETVYTGVCNCGATFSSEEERIAHSSAHSNNGEDTSYAEAYDEVEAGKIKVGSHTEDHGHYEKVEYVDYLYCGCGAQETR